MSSKSIDRRLVLSTSAYSSLTRYGNPRRKKEAGGILLGKVYKDSVIIEHVTTPTFLDKCGSFFFLRSRKSAQKEINHFWKESGGEIIYLGEWHSHLEENPSPSPEDYKMIQGCYKNTIMEIDFLYLIIVGLSGNIWVGVQSDRILTRIDLSHIGIDK